MTTELDTSPSAASTRSVRSTSKRIGFWLGLAGALALLLLPAPDGLSREGWAVVAVLWLMAVWWVTEALPIGATSLLPLLLFPLLGISDLQSAADPYAHRVVVLLLGGLIIAKSVERWGLHERLALLVVSKAGTGATALCFGFAFASAFLSAWISNTATTLMLMPIALSVAYSLGAREGRGEALTVALCLSVAFGASIGGISTPVGTATNLVVLGALEQAGDTRLDFATWMRFGVPATLVLLPLMVLTLTRLNGPLEADVEGDPQAVVRQRLSALGRWTRPEVRTLAVFGVVAFFWVFRRALLQDISLFGVQPFAGLSDPTIAVAGALALFALPSGSRAEPGARLLDWNTASRIPWDVVILFGGGMSLAAAITATGLGAWLGEAMGAVTSLPPILVILSLVVFVVFATELTSNAATAAALMPVIVALGAGAGTDPVLLAVPVAMAASCAFMFPIATPPNAIAYATGELSMARMAKLGLKLNIICIVAVTALASVLTPLVL